MASRTPKRVSRSRKHRHELMFSRVRESGSQGIDTILETFEVPVIAFKEDGVFVAIYEPMEGMLTGVGGTAKEAIEEFANCFVAMVEFHTENGTHQAFLEQYFSHEHSVRTVRVSVEEENRESFESMYPSYRDRVDGSLSRAAA